jgi:hypothetical protein
LKDLAVTRLGFPLEAERAVREFQIMFQPGRFFGTIHQRDQSRALIPRAF